MAVDEKKREKGLGMVRGMKVLYIAKRGPNNIAAKTHLSVIKAIYGADNVIEIDLLKALPEHKDRYIAYGYNSKNLGERIIRFLQGNSPFISNKIIGDLCSIIRENRISLVFSEESDLGNLYKKIKDTFHNVRIICFFHDISADLFAKRIDDAPKWKQHYILECKNIIKQEKVTQKYVDEKWVFNQADAERFMAHYGYAPDEIIPMGAPIPKTSEEYKKIVTDKEDKKQMLFVCSSYYVNIDGFKWFYQNVIPNLKKKYHIIIVGTGAQQLKSLITNEDIEILGRVESMAAYYESADVIIEPVFDGGGMKVKTIEALSFGKVIVSTSESLNGYWEKVPARMKNKLVFRCDTVNDWVESCNLLMKSEVKKYNEEVFDAFAINFSQEALQNNFEKALLN